MRKLVIIIFFTVTFVEMVSAQFEAQFSQYMFNSPACNPAAAGAGDLIDLRAQHRMNYLGIRGGGSSTNFGVNMPVKFFGVKHGVGLNFVNDQWGGFKNQAFRLQYAYRHKLANGIFSVGAAVGFASAGFSGDSISKFPITLGDHDMASDLLLPTASVSAMQFDAGAGVWFQNEKMYAGVSFLHLNRPTVVLDNRYFITQRGVLYLTGGYAFELEDSKITLTPTSLFMTEFTAWKWDLSARAEYDGKFWGGISLRMGDFAYSAADAVVVFLGLNIINGLSVGYSADISTNKLLLNTYGSHELMLMYSFAFDFNKKKHKYKSIRFL